MKNVFFALHNSINKEKPTAESSRHAKKLGKNAEKIFLFQTQFYL